MSPWNMRVVFPSSSADIHRFHNTSMRFIGSKNELELLEAQAQWLKPLQSHISGSFCQHANNSTSVALSCSRVLRHLQLLILRKFFLLALAIGDFWPFCAPPTDRKKGLHLAILSSWVFWCMSPTQITQSAVTKPRGRLLRSWFSKGLSCCALDEMWLRV